MSGIPTFSPSQLRRGLCAMAALIGLLAGLLVWRLVPGHAPLAAGPPAAANPPQQVASPPPKARPDEPAARPTPPAAEAGGIGLAEILASAAFAGVPAWLPRPERALRAEVEKDIRTADGSCEGTVRYLLAADPDACASWLRQAFAEARMEDRGGWMFQSGPPLRSCKVRFEPGGPNKTGVVLSYHGTDHQPGCDCPACTGTPDPG